MAARSATRTSPHKQWPPAATMRSVAAGLLLLTGGGAAAYPALQQGLAGPSPEIELIRKSLRKGPRSESPAAKAPAPPATGERAAEGEGQAEPDATEGPAAARDGHPDAASKAGSSPVSTGVPATPAANGAPKPDAWTDAEVIAALKDCLKTLGPVTAEISPADPLRAGTCGAPAPLEVSRVGSRPGVVIRPPATLNCAMLRRLAEWLETVVQPSARDLLGTDIVAISSLSGYQCRNRNNAITGVLSEHAYANAIDLSGFITADGRRIEVLKSWGETQRDKTSVADSASAKAGQQDAGSGADKDAKNAASKEKVEKPEGGKKTEQGAKLRKLAGGAAPSHLGGGVDARRAPPPLPAGKSRGEAKPDKAGDRIPAIPSGTSPKAAELAQLPETAFLRRVHKGTCGVFSTVLGPEANEAHRNHFHLDLKQRRGRPFCE